MPVTEVQRQEVQPQNVRAISRNNLAVAGLLALTFATFALTFSFGWVYDDVPQIPGNPNLSWNRLGFLFSHHLWAGIPGIANARFYRPLLASWFLLNKTVFGLNPHWFHVTSVLAHLLATLLAFFIARSLLRDATAALFAAALFAVHPLQAESVSWISSVNDPLAAVFCFGSFLACKKARAASTNAASWWSVSGLLFVCALLTKEVSIVLPAIVLADLCFDSNSTVQNAKSRAAAAIVALYGVPTIVWLAIRHHVLGSVAAAAHAADATSALLTAPKILLFQLWRVLLPIGLSPHYDFRPLAAGAMSQALAPLCAAIILILLAVFAAKKLPTLWVAFAWLIFPLLPSLNLRWLNEDDFVHDRYMYMGMLGVALIAGTILIEIKRRWPEQRLIPGLAFALIIGLAFASAIQSQFWANDVALFSRAVQIAPQNEWAQLSLGSALSARAKYADAAPHFVRSYELKPGAKAADYAGFAFANSGDQTQAEHWYTTALQQDQSLPDAWFALAQIRMSQQRFSDAIPLFQRALALNPNAEGYHYALGTALEHTGNITDAIQQYKIELQLYPSQTAARRAIDRLSVSR